ncbi:MAG: S41 family peptidase [Ignavibacteriaceae bacterium]|nr:S41 family peptidase [Ignavibacteriaceae bacterium]
MKNLLTLCILVIAANNIFPQTGNGFTAAFDSVHKKLSVYYAFTDWKNVNWQNLYNEFKPRIVTAETQNDSSAFIMAMKEYTFRIPDGHMGFGTGFYAGAKSDVLKKKNTNWVKLEEKLRDQQIGGSFGFTLIKLDDGRFVVRLVTEGSPAALAGIKFGAEIIEVNDKPITEVINSVSVIWAEQIPATKETKQLLQCRLIGRVPVNATMKIKFKNRGDVNPATQNLSAVNDNYATYDLTSMLPIKTPEIAYKILEPSGYGYLEITSCIPPVTVVTEFMSAFVNLLSANLKGMVVDLRINTGGQDSYAAAVAGCFYPDTTHYEFQSFYNPSTSTFQISQDILDHLSFQTVSFFKPTQYPAGSIFIEPQGLTFSGPVVVMVSPRNVSSGEGIAMALSKLPQCKVVSFYGSQGSFGITAPEFELLSPQDSMHVSYPHGRSLDIDNKIQVDSDSSMTGGVIPDVRPPLTDETINKMFVQGIDFELEYAVQELDKMVAVGVENGRDQKPLTFTLAQNYPNPFNPVTKITYQIPKAGKVELKVFDILGREIAELVSGEIAAGKYEIKFNGSNFSSGVYFYQLKSSGYVETKKLLLIK